ncbi:homeobox protein ARX, partial [Trichonephila clavipes]
MSRCPDQVLSLKQESQSLSPQASLVLIYRPTAKGMKGPKNFIDAVSNNENKMNNAVPVPTSSEMRNTSKKNHKIKKRESERERELRIKNIPPIVEPYLCTNQCIPHRPDPPSHWPPHPVGVPCLHSRTISNSVGTDNLPKTHNLNCDFFKNLQLVKGVGINRYRLEITAIPAGDCDAISFQESRMQTGSKQSENRGNFHSIQVMLGLQQELGCQQHDTIAAVSAALGYAPPPGHPQQSLSFGVSSASSMSGSMMNTLTQQQYTTARLRDGFAELAASKDVT